MDTLYFRTQEESLTRRGIDAVALGDECEMEIDTKV